MKNLVLSLFVSFFGLSAFAQADMEKVVYSCRLANVSLGAAKYIRVIQGGFAGLTKVTISENAMIPGSKEVVVSQFYVKTSSTKKNLEFKNADEGFELSIRKSSASVRSGYVESEEMEGKLICNRGK